MNFLITLCSFVIFLFISVVKCEDKDFNLEFPEDFLIGTATSAFQVEGAWNISGNS